MFFTEKDVGSLQFFVSHILECLDELMSEERNDSNFGQVLAYTHILRLIQGNCVEDEPLTYLGLDFDIDQKYFLG